MIIDAHVHLTSKPFHGAGPLTHLLPYLRRGVIHGALVIGELSWAGLDVSANKALALTAHEPRLRVAAEFDMNKPVRAELARLGGLRRDRRICAVKLYPGYQYHYPSERRLDPLYRYCAKSGLPVIVHTGDTLELPGEPPSLVKYAHPLALDEVAARHPNLRIIVAHLGNPWTMDAAEVIYKNKNVYGDVSGFLFDMKDSRLTSICARQINDVVAYCGARKLLFGSDWPLVDIALYLRFIRRFVKLRASERDAFFSGNARRIYGFS